MKISHIAASAALGLSVLAAPAFADAVYPDHPKGAGFVNDFAHVLSTSDQAKLERELRELNADMKVEVAVVTVTSLHGIPVSEYTNHLARTWGVSEPGVGNGIVFLIAPSEHHERIEVGTRLEPYITDARSKGILLHYYHPHAVEHDVPGAIVATTMAIDEAVRAFVTTDENKQILSHEKLKTTRVPSGVVILALFGLFLLVGLVAFFWPDIQKRLLRKNPSYEQPEAPTTAGMSPQEHDDWQRNSDAAGSGSNFMAGVATGTVLASAYDRREEEREDDDRTAQVAPAADDDDESRSNRDTGVTFGESDSDDNDRGEAFQGGGADGDD